MTNIENNIDKRFQQLSIATRLTTQSAKDDAFKQASAAKEAFLENMELGKKIEYASQQFRVFQVQIEKTELRVSGLTSQIRVLEEELNKINFSKVFDAGNEKTETYSDKFLNLYKKAKDIGEITSKIMTVIPILNSFASSLNGLGGPVLGLVIMGLEEVARSYIVFKKEVEAATKAMDTSKGTWDQKRQAVEKQIEILKKYKEYQDTRKIDRETSIGIEVLSEQDEELKKLIKEAKEAKLQLDKALSSSQDSSGIKYNIKELKQRNIDSKEKLNSYLKDKIKVTEVEEVEIKYKIKKEDVEKELTKFQSYIDDLKLGKVWTVVPELEKEGDFYELIRQYKELETQTGKAVEKTAKYEEILKKLEERKELSIQVRAFLDEHEMKEIEKIKDLAPNISEEKMQKLHEQFLLIKEDFENQLNNENLTMEAKVKIITNFEKDRRGLELKGYRSDESTQTGIENINYLEQVYNRSRNTPIIKQGNSLLDEIKKIVDEYKKALASVPKLAEGLELTELDQVSSKLSILEKAYTDLINKGADGMAKKLIPEMEKLRKETEELNKEDKVRNLFKGYREELEKSPTIAKILGLDEEAQLKQKITNLRNLLVGLYNADGTITDKATFEKYEAELKVLLEEEEAAKKMSEMKKKEENAMKDLVSVMNNFGGSLIAIGQGLNSTFLENTGNMINTFSSITNGFNLFTDKGGLGSITGMFKGGMAGSVKGLESITGALTSVSGMIAGFNVAKDLVGSLDGGKARKQIEENNEANKQAFKESTEVLLTFVEAIKSNISAINSYSNSLLGYATNNTTLSGIERVQKNFDLYINAMVDETKDFGTVTGLVKSKARYKSWFKSKSADTYEAVEVKEADILKSMGITNTTIDNMDENQLRDFAEKLKTTGRGDLLISLVDSNFEEWKEGVFEYVAQLDKLREEQNQLLRNSTLNAFEGIDVSSYKSLVQEYTQMFEDMGLNADAYKDTIEEMARNAQVLVTAMQDVRSSFIEALSSGETSDFSSSMSSYFKKILNNAAQVTYDVAYSSIDEYMTKEFEKISEKLVDMKKNGVLDFNGFWDNFNFNKILEADRITTDYEKVINDLRSQLENRGFSSSLIDSMLPATELSERVDSIKSMLSSVMSEALNNNSFASFEESLGNSIYESVKDSLIQAFVDSEVYRTYMNQFYNMDDIKEKLSQATSAQQGFDVMQDYLKDLEYELEKMGLNRGNAASGNSTEENTLGNSYYQDSGIEYNITIEQHFSGVYGFDAMYDVAKQGATEAIEEWKNQGKVISTI
ncbi:hypothetical protein [Fusobacterium sp.]|uniref:hypothetical protein n=1 Tax=Fusobacterium sp. TaxID=68766 RepID=UPI0029037602|nr:hypothetical protein [Fusobacterium sp.]MDU1912057.1 hypothetical protein [Fusobacterium sp.]